MMSLRKNLIVSTIMLTYLDKCMLNVLCCPEIKISCTARATRESKLQINVNRMLKNSIN